MGGNMRQAVIGEITPQDGGVADEFLTLDEVAALLKLPNSVQDPAVARTILAHLARSGTPKPPRPPLPPSRRPLPR